MHVLLVEDNDDHAELLMRGMEGLEINTSVQRVDDGSAALDYLFQEGAYAEPGTSKRPQLVLLDLRLPKVEGLEVLQRIKTSESLQSLPVVVLSTSAAEEDMARAYEYNANAYVTKPTDFSEMVQFMRDLGSFWLRWNQPPQR